MVLRMSFILEGLREGAAGIPIAQCWKVMRESSYLPHETIGSLKLSIGSCSNNKKGR